MSGKRRKERTSTLVIGGGQAGLSVGYHLARRGVEFLVLDASERIGDAWRKRWDSLRLFTPARFNALDGMPFPAEDSYFPTKDEMADYLESYADRFDLPVRSGSQVRRLTRENGRFVALTDDARYEADTVVVAMSDYQRPRLPGFAGELDPSILQMHSVDYRNPRQLREGPVLLVGAGNSAADLAMELAKTSFMSPWCRQSSRSSNKPRRFIAKPWSKSCSACAVSVAARWKKPSTLRLKFSARMAGSSRSPAR